MVCCQEEVPARPSRHCAVAYLENTYAGRSSARAGLSGSIFPHGFLQVFVDFIEEAGGGEPALLVANQ